MNKLIENLKSERESVKASISAITEKAGLETRDLTDIEDKNITDLAKRLDEIDARLNQLVEIELRNAKATEVLNQLPQGNSTGGVKVVNEGHTYEKRSQNSFFADMVKATKLNDPAAWDRLNRHRHELAVDRRDSTQTSDLSSGFVPPAYLGDDYAELRKYGRPVANFIGSRPLTNKSMSIPRVTQGTDVDFQTEESAGASTGFTSSDITADSKTLSGYVDVTLQTLDWAQGLDDSDIYMDLVKSYNQKVETFVLQNNVSNAYGILEASGTNYINYDDSSADWANFNLKVAAAKKAVYVNYKGSADAMVVAPTMYAWLEGLLDGNNQPVFAPVNPSNNPGNLSLNIAEGPVGRAFGLPVIVSHGMPSDYLDSATPSDIPVIIGALRECRLWESEVRTARFEDVKSAELMVRFRLHAYVAFTAARHPSGISIIGGTAFTTSALGF